MTHEDALVAIETAAASDDGNTPDPVASLPADQAQPTASAVAPAGEISSTEQTSGATEDSAQFFNPDTLDPALLPGWKQLQAAFTQKTQAIAAEKAQIEALGGAEIISEAVELYQRISDPDSWPQLQQELAEAMVEAGMSPVEAHQAAAEELRSQSQSENPFAGLDLDDPELAPLARALQAQADQTARLEQQLQSLTTDQQLRYQTEQAQLEQQARQQQFQSDLGAIQAARPDYDNDDLRAVVEMAPFYNDDLGQAAAAYESNVARRLDRYFAAKKTAANPAFQPHAGAGADSSATPPTGSLRDAEAEAIEYLNGLQAAGELDV